MVHKYDEIIPQNNIQSIMLPVLLVYNPTHFVAVNIRSHSAVLQ